MENLNTSVDASTTSWLTDLELDDYNLFPEYDLSLFNIDETEFLSHDIASSMHPLHSDEMNLERPTKQIKISPDLSSSSSPTTTTTTLNPKQGNTNSITQTRKGSLENQSKGTKRPSSHGHDHIMAERKRRENLSQSLIALAALIPGLKKMDKASVLGDAIKYMKDLKERLRLLEEESHKRVVESVVIVNKPRVNGDYDSSLCDESEALPLVDARVSDKEVLLRIHCQKENGILVQILDHVQKLHLFVVNSSVLSFGKNSVIHITAKMGTGYNLSLKDLLTKLRVATLKSMS